MKKILSLSILSVGLMLLSSCSKDWNCTCAIVTTDQGGAEVSRRSSATVINGTKGKSTDECEKSNAQSSGNGFTTTTTCVLEAR
ncbi:MAG: hypothetical protein Q8J69_11925 [Sphingobacteriaceae bacterium]|nr:hypothetical protein [Sphingobacteriaceae bacterium]